MERTKLSQLLKIISRDSGQLNLNSRPYDPKNFRKDYLKIEKNRVRQEDYKSRDYVQNKNMKKR